MNTSCVCTSYQRESRASTVRNHCPILQWSEPKLPSKKEAAPESYHPFWHYWLWAVSTVMPEDLSVLLAKCANYSVRNQLGMFVKVFKCQC